MFNLSFANSNSALAGSRLTKTEREFNTAYRLNIKPWQKHSNIPLLFSYSRAEVWFLFL